MNVKKQPKNITLKYLENQVRKAEDNERKKQLTLEQFLKNEFLNDLFLCDL